MIMIDEEPEKPELKAKSQIVMGKVKEEDPTEKDELSPAPEVEGSEGEDSDLAPGKVEGEELKTKAREVLGREPMSTVKSKKGDEESKYNDQVKDSEYQEEVFDEQAYENLKRNKVKPRNLYERMQANLGKKMGR